VLGCLLLVSGAAFAAGGGSGGAGIGPAPRVSGAQCLATKSAPCADPHWVVRGGTIEVEGSYFTGAGRVIFLGRAGHGDDAAAPARSHGTSRLTATVPANARTGPLAVVSGAGVRSRRWNGIVVDVPTKGVKVPASGSDPGIGAEISNPHKIFFGGLEKAVFTYQVGGASPVDVTVSLVRLADGAVVRTWSQPQVAPAVPTRVIWDGKARGRVQPEGYYTFRASTGTATAAQVTASAGQDDSFAFYGNMFPVQGPHDYGDAAARFGASRTGHIHQGQDVMATCGTPLIAARAGKVVYRGYHSRAGYYLVIHGDWAGQDYMYAHLRTPAVVKAGDRVYTGQPIGEVGDTGDAVGCHLHLELWSAPGWYKGGHPFDPLPQLKLWDKVS
jgi:murein DD-endopeptidase MepM/ murein hydrolase activator NlpD